MPKILIFGQMPRNASPDQYIAAGPWCFAGQENRFQNWEKDFSFAPEPLQDPFQILPAAKQAQALSMAIIPVMAAHLSKNSDDLPEIYWETLLLPWVIAVASQIVERWLRIKAMKKIWSHIPLLIPLMPASQEFNFQDENDYNLRGALGLTYNWYLFSRLIEMDCPSKWQLLYEKKENPLVKNGRRVQASRQWKEKLKNIFLNLPFPILKGLSPSLSILFSLMLLHRTHLPVARSRKSLFENPDLLKQLPELSTLEPIFKISLPASIKNLDHEIHLKKSAHTYLKLASISAYENAVYRQKLAKWKAENCRLACAQHGGNYGQAKVVCNSAIVEYAEDAFFTWGWKKHGDAWGNFIPMPWPQLQKIRNRWKNKSDSILFVGTEMACYAYRLESRPTPLQFIKYRYAKAEFLNSCSPIIRKRILYRPYFKLSGTLEDAEWITARFPDVRICSGNLYKILLSCSLLILDHPGTLMLEAFAANIPVLLFWNRESWPWTEEGEKMLNEMQQAGIWHSTPVSCAKMAEKVIPSAARWWHSTPVQECRKNYCKDQARTIKSGFIFTWIKKLFLS